TRQDYGAIADPHPVSDNHVPSAVREIRRLRVVTECQNRCLGSNRNIVACFNRESSAVQHAAEIHHVPFPEKNLPAVEETAAHLNGCPLAFGAQPYAEVDSPNDFDRHMRNDAVVPISEERSSEESEIHEQTFASLRAARSGFLLLTNCSQRHAESNVSSNVVSVLHPSSRLASCGSAQIFSISPSRRLAIL